MKTPATIQMNKRPQTPLLSLPNPVNPVILNKETVAVALLTSGLINVHPGQQVIHRLLLIWPVLRRSVIQL
uniref:Alternative protein IGSF5 n=1 Tax=Homo sapiens TaxID=9606 RepID=L8E8K9_HUMAN|nr:alternative protein IGSF5 [Homo sapiens]